ACQRRRDVGYQAVGAIDAHQHAQLPRRAHADHDQTLRGFETQQVGYCRDEFSGSANHSVGSHGSTLATQGDPWWIAGPTCGWAPFVEGLWTRGPRLSEWQTQSVPGLRP